MSEVITPTMKDRIENCMEFFYEKTLDGHIIKYLNGFTGVGILEEPDDHITKAANTIWIYGCGFSKNGKRIVENTNILLTEDEAKDLKKCISIALSKHDKYYKKLTRKERNQIDTISRTRISEDIC